MKQKILFFACFFLTGLLAAQEIPTAKSNLVNYQRLKVLGFEKEGQGNITNDKAANPKHTSLTVTTIEQPDFIYNLATKIPLKKTAIAAGETLLLSFEAKTNFSSLETGEARCQWILNVSDNRKEKVFKTLSISSDWQTYYIPFPIDEKISPKQLSLALQFGFPPQEFLIKKIELNLFDKSVAVADLPKTKITYQGMEEEALWRKTANERIEKFRKGDFELVFTRDGVAQKDIAVKVEMKEHHFSWGAAINAKKVVNDPLHLSHFSKTFNLAVFENDLKIKSWNREEKREQTLKAIDLLVAKDIDIKGHVLIWPGFRHLPKHYKKNENKPKKICNMMKGHVSDILTATKGKIDRWDVVNEAYTNTDLQRITGSEDILFHGFKKLRNTQPNVLRYTNEYGIISKGGLDTKKQEWYFKYIKRIDEATKNAVDGIGIQCHIGSDLTSPERVVAIIDYYAQLKKKISISEFTMEIKDSEIRKKYTEDFMTAAFSHPAVSEFLFWGYQREKADIFTEDWKIGIMGEAYFSLVHDKWKTKYNSETDTDGKISSRGFYGTYVFSYDLDGETRTGTFDLLPGAANQFEIKMK